MDLLLFIKLFTLICPPIGILLNLLVIWLILVKTPKEMLKYSRILLQTCIFDIVFLLHEIIGIQLPISVDNMFFGIYYGYFAIDFYHLFGPFGLFVLTNIHTFLYGFDIMLIVFQFIYRYFLYNRNTQISLIRYLQFIILPILLNIIFISITLAKFHDSILNCRPAEDFEYLKSINMIEESCFVVVDEKLVMFMRNFLLWLCFLMIFFYSIIIILRWRIIRFVNSHGGFSEMTRKLNKQLTRTLTLLAAFPFLTFCFMLFYSIYFFSGIRIDNRENSNQMQLIGVIFFYITSALNPIITILINTPYRNAIVRIFCHKSPQQIVPA